VYATEPEADADGITRSDSHHREAAFQKILTICEKLAPSFAHLRPDERACSVIQQALKRRVELIEAASDF